MSMAVERAYWSARKTVERAVGGVLFDVGNRLALSGHERIAKPLIEKGLMLDMVSRLSHEPIQFDPAILNEDGSLNPRAWRAKLARMGGNKVAQEQAYYWTPEWQADERAADEDIKAGRVRTFQSAEEAIREITPDISNQIFPPEEKPNNQ